MFHLDDLEGIHVVYCTKIDQTSDRTRNQKMLSDRLTTAMCQTRKYLMLPLPLLFNPVLWKAISSLESYLIVLN
jgi:hypothetical protein